MLKTAPVFKFPGGPETTLAEVGGKGLSLIKSSDAGLPVPPGFILAVEFFAPWLNLLKGTDAWKKFIQADSDQMKAACANLKSASDNYKFTDEQRSLVEENLKAFTDGALFAVRSSSPEEDLEGASFAGGYETLLGVNKASIEDAVLRAFASCLDFRVAAYKKEHGFDATSPKIAVVIQRQIASEVAGVGFSINPLTNNYDEAVFNANFGLGETVVGGLATPDTFKVDKASRTVTARDIGGKETSIWLEPDGGTTEKPASNKSELTLTDDQILQLSDLVAKVEKLYGRPIDTEWAFAEKQLYLLQARPITAYMPLAPDMVTVEGERKTLYIDVSIVVQGLYKPISTAGTDLLRILMTGAGEDVLGVNPLGDPKKSIIAIENGRLYLNASILLAMVGKDKLSNGVASMDPMTSRAIAEADESEYKAGKELLTHPSLHLLTRLPEVVTHLMEARLLPEHAHKNTARAITKFMAEMREDGQSDRPVWEIANDLIPKTFKFIFSHSIPLFIASRVALKKLQEIATAAGVTDPELLTKLERALPHNVTTEMGLALYHLSELQADSKSFSEQWTKFLELYGHRGSEELDVASPRYRDQPQMLTEQIETLRKSASDSDNPQSRFDKAQVERQEAYETIAEQVQQHSGWIQLKRFQSLYRVFETLAGYREIHKYLLVYAIDLLRERLLKDAVLLVAQKRLDNMQQIFDLTMQDLKKAASDKSLDLRQAGSDNRAFADRLASVTALPTLFDSRGRFLRPKPTEPKEGEVAGTPISPGVIRGRIKVLHSPEEKPLLRGEILVARATDPGWTPLFVNAAAVILEIGGMLQHGALVAREYGLPCVSGVANATEMWPDGTLVEVDGTAGIIRLIEAAAPSSK